MTGFSYQQLRDAVDGGAVAVRSTLELAPAGGSASKVMPPTYGVDDRADHKYAVERRVDENGEVSTTVLLDSVASQANRMEEALLDGWEREELHFTVASVDFTGEDGLADLGHLTSLEAPHRLADAIFRDSLLENTLFRLSDVGRAITDATPANAIALMTYCPHALLFGMWDSTGPKGGLGSKFQRSIVSEIVGFDAQTGVSVGSRLDPFEIRAGVAGIVKSNDDDVWDFADDAKKGVRPSEINHGNVTPSIDDRAGGVTISHAVQSAVISLAGLRKLKFPVDGDGNPIAGPARRSAETAARAALAAIGLAALVYQNEADFDLRSRCLLVPTGPMTFEVLGRNGEAPEKFTLDRDAAAALLSEAAAEAATHRVGFGPRSLVLQPAPKLVELLRRSRELAAEEAPAS